MRPRLLRGKLGLPQPTTVKRAVGGGVNAQPAYVKPGPFTNLVIESHARSAPAIIET
jgi:hypothetical protein